MQSSTIWLRPLLALFCLLAFTSNQALASRDGSTDRPGLDYNKFELSSPNPDLCENACKKDTQCRSWTYSWPGAKGPKAMCALKTGVPPKRSDTCCISGIISTSEPVKSTQDTKPTPAPIPPVAPKITQKPEPVKPAQTTTPKTDKPIVAKPSEPVPAPLPSPPQNKTVIITPKPKPQLTLEPEKPEIAEPKQDPAKVTACNDYASRALAQNAENKRLACGLTGSRWGYGKSSYFNYCMANPSSSYNGSRAARDRELDVCKAEIASRGENNNRVELPEVGDIFNADSRSAGFCRSYATQSVEQANEARRYNCGFGGRNWSTSRIQQVRICESVGTREAASLLNYRARELDSCRRSTAGTEDGGRASNCREYARTAVAQAIAARRYDCGYGSRGRWSRNFRAHLRWCQRVPRAESNREFNIREQLLAQCE
ncbi:MAG: PAN domain-containing protein [Anderseniella sp.]